MQVRPHDFALFDFDVTITTIGTYPSFVSFAFRPRRKLVGYILLAEGSGHEIHLYQPDRVIEALTLATAAVRNHASLTSGT